jgi:cell division protein ZipA
VDIKDYILIGGGLLIAAVVAHGFWIAWRNRQEPLRIDIQPGLIPDDMDDLDRLRAELPTGGARVVKPRDERVEQAALWEGLEDPDPAPAPAKRQREPVLVGAAASGQAPRREPSLSGPAAEEADPPEFELAPPAPAPVSASDDGLRTEPRTRRGRPAPADAGRVKVADVALPGDGRSNGESRRNASRRAASRKEPARRGAGRADEPKAIEQPPAIPDELIILNVLAEHGRPYMGDAIYTVLRGSGLKFGDMNIFHRVDPLTKAVDYSIANVVEPGTFDMSEMEAFHAPGLCFFMQLPGPERPGEAFEDMFRVAREVADRLGGEVCDEQRNRMMPQTVEHYRQRIADFSRRRMSKRA